MRLTRSGYKNTFLDNTLQFNTSAFLYDWQDLQLFESYGGGPTTVNVPGVKIQGVEVEVKWAPDDRWYFQGSAGTAHSKVNDITGLNPASAAQIGKHVTHTPRYSYAMMGSYRMPLTTGSLALSMNYRYQGSSYHTFLQDNPRDTASPAGFLDARIAYNFGTEEQHTAALWGNNLTETFTCGNVVWGPGTPQSNFGCNASSFGEVLWGITLETKFE